MSTGTGLLELGSLFRLLRELKTTKAGLTLLTADPGAGKSHQTRIAMAQMIQSDPEMRFLYLTPDTVRAGSLGAEALAHFQQLGVGVELLRGQQVFPAHGRNQAYRHQFVWSNARVKIMPHRYLAFLRKPRVRSLVFGAHVVVIDEDPSGSLIEDEYLVLTRDAFPETHVRVQGMLQVFAGESDFGAPGEAVWISRNPVIGTRRFVFSGSAVSELLNGPEARQTHFLNSERRGVIKQRVGARRNRAVAEVVGALKVGSANLQLRVVVPLGERHGPIRVGLAVSWNNTLEKKFPPVLVLDAYGDNQAYATLLGRSVRLEDARSGNVPRVRSIVVENASYGKLGLDAALRLRTDRSATRDPAVQRFLGWLLAHEVRVGKPVTFIGHKDHLEPLSATARESYQAIHGHPLDHAQFSYYQGRGINSLSGRDAVVTLNAHSDAMAGLLKAGALYPDPVKTPERLAWFQRRNLEELVQAIHRVRPIQYPEVRLTLITPRPLAEVTHLHIIPEHEYHLRPQGHDHLRDQMVLRLLSGLLRLLVTPSVKAPVSAGIPLAALACAGLLNGLKISSERYRELLAQPSVASCLSEETRRWVLAGIAPEDMPLALITPWSKLESRELSAFAPYIEKELGLVLIDEQIWVLSAGDVKGRKALLAAIRPPGKMRGRKKK